MDTMIDTIPTHHQPDENVMVTTVAENLVRYTKREVTGAKRK